MYGNFTITGSVVHFSIFVVTLWNNEKLWTVCQICRTVKNSWSEIIILCNLLQLEQINLRLHHTVAAEFGAACVARPPTTRARTNTAHARRHGVTSSVTYWLTSRAPSCVRPSAAPSPTSTLTCTIYCTAPECVSARHGTGSLGHRVNGSFGSFFTVRHFDPVWDPSFSGFRKKSPR